MALTSKHMAPKQVDMDRALDNSFAYMQMHVQYPYIAMSLDLCDPFRELQLKLCVWIGVITCCENTYLLRHRSEHSCASIIYYEVDKLKKHCTVQQSK